MVEVHPGHELPGALHKEEEAPKPHFHGFDFYVAGYKCRQDGL